VQAVIDLNARSVVSMTRAAAPWLEHQGGFVINTTSIAARNGGAGGAIVYAAAKGFVSTLTRGHAKELIGKKIRVNAVAPGVIATPFHDRYTDSTAMEALRKTIPLGREGTPEECVGAYLFLASEALSGYIIGQIIEVNGGQLMP
jgi:3-oxoacyl-[acyl-carrier protein] reductase